ncbi:MAG: hypothetical protein D6696_16640 [Acidobacteria bacterium]|nr:MAG: hypothetical protein D6696_16640 [Acidobacteriota bacterium]
MKTIANRRHLLALLLAMVLFAPGLTAAGLAATGDAAAPTPGAAAGTSMRLADAPGVPAKSSSQELTWRVLPAAAGAAASAVLPAPPAPCRPLLTAPPVALPSPLFLRHCALLC